MKARTIDQIEKAFREIGLTEATWGRKEEPPVEVPTEVVQNQQTFIRMENTTTPLEAKPDADVA